MAVDNNASSLAPTPVVSEHQKPISTEHNPDPKTIVAEILDKPNQSPHDILTQLAAIDPNKTVIVDDSSEANIDNSLKNLEEPITIDPQPETPHIDTAALKQEDQRKTAEEIKQVSETIQQESTPKVETAVETPKTLFPDTPPLYDKYHKAYEKEKKTIRGALTRSRDIRLLRKDYANSLTEKYQRQHYYSKDYNKDQKGAANFYDTLRSRAIFRSDIMAKDSDGRLIINKKLSPNSNYATGIQRLDSLGLFQTSLLYSDKTPTRSIEDIQKMTNLYDDDFKDTKDQLNQYSFLSGQDIIPFITNGRRQEVYQALSSIQKEFFSTPENQQKFSDYLSQHPELGDNLFGFVRNINKGYNDSFNKMSPFVAALIDSGVNSGQKINIPQECFKAHCDSYGSYEKLWYLESETRDQQRFFLEKSKTQSQDELKMHYFNYDNKPNFNYFRDNFVFKTGIDTKVTLPDGTIIDSTQSKNVRDFKKFILASSFPPEDQSFYHGLASLNGNDENSFITLLNNRDVIEKYFQPGMPLTSEFYREIIHNPKFKNEKFYFYGFLQPNLTPDVIQNFPSPEDRTFWNNVLTIPEHQIYNLEPLFTNESYLSSEGLPTSEFFKDFFYSQDIHLELRKESITSFLTPDFIHNFPSPEDRKFWNSILGMSKSEWHTWGTFKFLSENKSYFNSKGELTSTFFKNYCTSYENYPSFDLITSNLTSDVLQNFSSEDQKFWANIIKLKGIGSREIKTFIEANSDPNQLFNQEGQPQSYLFDFLAKNGNLQLIKDNLIPDLIKTFPSSKDRIFWNNFLSLKGVNDEYLRLLFSKDIYLNSEGKPTSAFFKEAIHQGVEKQLENSDKYFSEGVDWHKNDNPIYGLMSNLTPDIIKTFPSSKDRIFWNNILELKTIYKIPTQFLLLFKEDNYLNSKGKLTPEFFKATLFEKTKEIGPYSESTYQYIIANLTPELITTFDSKEQNLFTNIANLKRPDKVVFGILSENLPQIDSYFTKDHLPNRSFFQKYFDKKDLDLEFLQSNLTPEMIQIFLPKEQSFWNGIINLKELDEEQIRFISSSRKSNTLFTKTGQPQAQLFKILAADSRVKIVKENLTPDVIKNFPSKEDQKFWNGIRQLNGLNGDLIKTIVEFNDPNALFTETGQPQAQLFKILDADGSAKIVKENLTPDVIKNFPSPEDQKFWNGVRQLKELDDNSLKTIIQFGNPNILFENTGQPQAQLFEALVASNLSESSCFKQNLTSEIINSFTQDQEIWQTALTLSSKTERPNIRKFIYQNRESISQKINSSLNPEEILKQYISVAEQIESSPSKEIQKIKDQLTIEILNSSTPLESFQKISDIFVKNNLPMVGKVYRVFDAIYPPAEINKILLDNGRLSRVLIDTKSPRLRQQIIFNDLLKVNLGSGEQSLVNYLNLFQTSSPLLEKSKSGVDLTSTESAQLSSFFKKLDTLYDASLLKRIQPTEILDTPTLQSKTIELYQKYKVVEGQSISDRVAQMYLSTLDIKSIPQAFDYIKQTRESAHQRNLNMTDFSLGSGDLVKGVKSENLDNILNFGCVAREYLGSDSGSDMTPLDTDVIMVENPAPVTDIYNIGEKTYGDLFVVVKNRGQFQNTTNVENPNYDAKKIEVFYSGGVNEHHYGVRTGFPSSEIDFLVTTNATPQLLDGMYYEIAKHGVYIPVLDLGGNQLFTPEDYSRYRHSFDGVNQFSGDSLKVETSPVDDPFRSEIDNFKKSLETETSDEVVQADTQVREKIKSILDSLNINLKDQFDNSLIGARLYNIGSSGRHTNLPGDFDFDYNLILDVPNYPKSQQLISEIDRQLPHQGKINAEASQVRLTGVTGIAPEPIDLDIGINTTADTLIFASHEAIEQKLDSVKQTYGQDTYNEVIANILLTKQILKQNHAYKKGDNQDGGFGGIGTENWILSNNGSIKKAFESFWQAAHNNGKEVSLDQFRTKYSILDSGQNLRDTGRHHDNFVFTLTDKGYHSMLQTIGKYIT